MNRTHHLLQKGLGMLMLLMTLVSDRVAAVVEEQGEHCSLWDHAQLRKEGRGGKSWEKKISCNNFRKKENSGKGV